MGVEEEVPSGLKAGTTSAGRWYWRCNGHPNSRQPRAITLNAIALQYLDGSGHDLEKNEFENSLGRAGGCACVEGNPASGRTEFTPRRSTHHSYSVVALIREGFQPFYLIMSNSPRIWRRRTAVEFFVTRDAKPGVGRPPLTQLRPYLRALNSRPFGGVAAWLVVECGATIRWPILVGSRGFDFRPTICPNTTGSRSGAITTDEWS